MSSPLGSTPEADRTFARSSPTCQAVEAPTVETEGIGTQHPTPFQSFDVKAFATKIAPGQQDWRGRAPPMFSGAAEILIHGVRPYLPVTIIGEPTCGAPYGTLTLLLSRDPEQYLMLIVGRAYAVNGEPATITPIEPTCGVSDVSTQLRASALKPRVPYDRDWQPPNVKDPLYREAIHYLTRGQCSTR